MKRVDEGVDEVDITFWHTRWSEGRIGFHQHKINSRLKKFWNTLALEKGASVFVPLCGKSLDMLWLAQQGYKVIGLEISERACHDFYLENKLRYEVKDGTPFTKFFGGSIEIWCGDFFDLKASDLNNTHAVYDRASLIAFPESMRPDYATHLANLLQPGSQVFLISMDYDETKMKGPPFSVPETSIRPLFQTHFSIDLITQSSGPDIVGNLAERGLDTLNEKIYLLRRL